MVTRVQQLPPSLNALAEDVAAAYCPDFREIHPRARPPVEYVGEEVLPTLPSEILLGSLRDGRLKVCKPIKVSFSTEGTHVIAEALGLSEFGFGESHSAALTDLQHAVAELYFTLEEEKKHLGNDLQEVWSRLQERIHKR